MLLPVSSLATTFMRVFFTLVFALLATTLRGSAMDTYLGAQTYEDLYYLPSPEALTVMSLGHREPLTDLIWMKALVYLGEEFLHQGDVEHVFRYASAILHLDPEFRAGYEWVAMAALYRPTEVGPEEGRQLLPFLREAAARFPEDGEMAWTVGATMSYDIAPLLEGDERDQVTREGLTHLLVAAELGAGPPHLMSSNIAQLRRLGQAELAVRHLEAMLPMVDDPAQRDALLRQIADARGVAVAEGMRTALEDASVRHASLRPWVPFDFFLLLEPRTP